MWDLPMGHVPNGLLPYHGFGQSTYIFSSPPKSIPLKTWMPPPEPVPQKNWILEQYHEFPLPPTPPTYSSAIETFYFTVKQPEHIFTTIEKLPNLRELRINLNPTPTTWRSQSLDFARQLPRLKALESLETLEIHFVHRHQGEFSREYCFLEQAFMTEALQSLRNLRELHLWTKTGLGKMVMGALEQCCPYITSLSGVIQDTFYEEMSEENLKYLSLTRTLWVQLENIGQQEDASTDVSDGTSSQGTSFTIEPERNAHRRPVSCSL
ncbi:hypothetical protein K470DRAFT_262750 [Piedraia hortae CBS 480.64]|uniref:F-box domain-containing protein n=1 Tax=Piedraia hortae CBS 480.64 TaxID=1314780 RepID=A0A6A7C5J0_9PEZI|nr:hypothetical protein K470DRAFT_262750 [Piedraia hortae CBS 480.64]